MQFNRIFLKVTDNPSRRQERCWSVFRPPSSDHRTISSIPRNVEQTLAAAGGTSSRKASKERFSGWLASSGENWARFLHCWFLITSLGLSYSHSVQNFLRFKLAPKIISSVLKFSLSVELTLSIFIIILTPRFSSLIWQYSVLWQDHL